MRHTLKKRSEFLDAKKYGQVVHTSSFLVQYYLSPERTDIDFSSEQSLLHGYTVTKRIGNAVVRNRTKRRLREAYALSLKIIDLNFIPPHQALRLVIIAKTQILGKSFDEIQKDMQLALQKIKRDLAKHQAIQKKVSV